MGFGVPETRNTCAGSHEAAAGRQKGAECRLAGEQVSGLKGVGSVRSRRSQRLGIKKRPQTALTETPP